jgi:hypothetical protein
MRQAYWEDHIRASASLTLVTTGAGEQRGGLVPPEEPVFADRLRQSAGEADEPQAVRLHVVAIQSKLGLEPCDPPSGARSPEPVPGKRARMRRPKF